MEKKMYFEQPVQVIWIDADNVRHAGIAYHDEIICACCGGIEEIAEIYEVCPEGIENPIIELEWTSIREEIGGDYLYQEENDD